MGSLNPAIRFKKNGEESISREGIYAAQMTAKVGKPLDLSAFVKDRGERRGYEWSIRSSR
ncbi:MAG: hypothetical protein R3F26_05970 [Gammaproteobacteria bacterium]